MKIIIKVDINKRDKIYDWSIFNDIILKDYDKLCNKLKLMTTLFYILMKFIIENKFFVVKSAVKDN